MTGKCHVFSSKSCTPTSPHTVTMSVISPAQHYSTVQFAATET